MLDDEFARISKLLKRELNQYETQLLFRYVDLRKKIRFQLHEAFLKAGIDGPIKQGELNWHFAEMNKYNRLALLEQNITEEIAELSGTSVNNIQKHLVDSFQISRTATFEAINKGLGISIKFQKINRDLILESIKNPYDRVGWNWRTEGHHLKSIDFIKQEITAGLTEGKGYAQTAANISDKINDLANNVTRIVRTESHRVQQVARLNSMKESEKAARRLGIKLKRKWVSILDSKIREQHYQMNGQFADENNLFHFPDGNTTEAPCISGIAHHDINCRCQIISVLG
jgi:hypothetical protein